jgi:hypothetical protein
MGRNFYYGKDARIVAGSAGFAARINVDPEAYGIPPWRAERYAELDARLQAAYGLVASPLTKSPVAVREKDEALRAVRLDAANLAAIVYATPAVDDAELLALGLLPRPTRTRRAAPDEAPIVSVAEVIGRRVTVRITARSGETRKPIGCVGAQLFVFTGEEPPSDAGLYRFEGTATRKTATITFDDDVPSGATVWISAAWISRRAKTSPACNPVSATIQGGPVTIPSGALLAAAA